MAVVVTGAAGFIGRHVVRRIRQRGISVVGVDRCTWTPMAGEAAIVADVAEPDVVVDRMLRRATGVIHLAACAGVRDHRPDVAARRWRDNVVAGARVLEVTPTSTMVVVASSSSVYGGAGPVDRPRPCREDDPVAPQGGYARSKWALERRAMRRAAAGGAVGVVRPFTVAGPGQRPDMAIGRWIAALQAGRELLRYGAGDRRRDITDVFDVAEGIVRMLDRRITTTVNLGTGVTHRLDDVLTLVARRCGVEPTIRVAAVHPADVATTLADIDRCHRLLGFIPEADLPAMIDRQVSAATTLRSRDDRAPRAAAECMPAGGQLAAD